MKFRLFMTLGQSHNQLKQFAPSGPEGQQAGRRCSRRYAAG